MNSLATITLNLQYPNIAAVVYAMQGDRLSRSIEANLVDGSTPWTPPAGAYGLITVEKPDGTVAVYDTMEDGSAAVSISGSTATLRLAEQTMTVAGAAKMNVSFFRGNGSRLSSFRITLVVAPQAVLDNVISANYISVFTATLAQIAADAAEAEQMFEQIKAAYGAPLVAATAAAMTDQSRVYVYTGSEAGYTNGNWYYWDGSAWASGGVYNSTAFETDPSLSLSGAAADAKAAGDAIAPAFSTTVDYRVNHYVMYNGKVYRFKKDHPAGAWVSGDVEAATAASAWRDLTPLALAQGNVPAIAGTAEAHIDLNDFTSAGNYKVTTMANAKTIDNMPISNPQAGRLIVFLASGSGAVVQIYLMHTSSHPLIHVRNKTSSGWNPWERLLTTAYVDTAPTEGSDHPISSGAVYEALNAMTAAEGTAW